MSDMSGQSAGGGYRPAGWYYAQGDPPGTQRYWDGASWQGEPQPVNPTARYTAPEPASTAEPSTGFSGQEATVAWTQTPDPGNADTGIDRSRDLAGSGGSSGSADVKGFLSTLFDTTFTSFITGRAVSVVYILVLVAVALLTLLFVIGGLAGGGASGLVALILGPLIGLFYLVMIRMTLEFFMNQFRQTELLEAIAERIGRDAD